MQFLSVYLSCICYVVPFSPHRPVVTAVHTHLMFYSLFFFLSIFVFVCIFYVFFVLFSHTHTHIHRHTAGRLLGSWRSVHPPVCPPNRPTDSSSHFYPKNSRSLTHQVMKINQPSRPRLRWTFPQKSASVPASESDSVQFTDDDHVIM